MAGKYDEELLEDLKAPESYGRPLVGWKGKDKEIYRDGSVAATLGPLERQAPDFVEQVYFLVSTKRSLAVYRGYETEGLKAPYGRDHPSYINGLVDRRNPGTPKGRWWSPARPSRSIDNLGLSSLDRGEDRDRMAVLLEWSRLDYYIEAELPSGSLVYVGRAAPQRESALYGRQRYGGGGIQFFLPDAPEKMLKGMKEYAAQ